MKTLGNKGMTMLHFALAHAKETYNQPQLDIITALMRAGADYRQASPPPPENDTPLNLALFLSPKYPLILKAMLEGGLPPNSPIRPEWPDSRIIEELIFDEDLEALKMLVAYGADVNHQTATGKTPLHAAYGSSKQYDTMYFLLSVGANPEIPDGVGYTVTYEVYEDLETFDRKSPKRKKLVDFAAFLQSKGYKWPPLTPLEQRDAMRARGETPRVPGGQTR